MAIGPKPPENWQKTLRNKPITTTLLPVIINSNRRMYKSQYSIFTCFANIQQIFLSI